MEPGSKFGGTRKKKITLNILLIQKYIYIEVVK